MNSLASAGSNKLSHSAVYLLVMLAILDAVFTHIGVQGGHITEANPIMRSLYDFNVGLFFVIKILLPVVLMRLLSRFEPNPFIQLMIAGTIFVYVFVLLMHIYWFAHLFI